MTGKQIGHYTIERELSAGGMGTIYLARHDELKRTVAIKVLRPEFSADKSFVERFEREARTIAKLEHVNILQVYDFGRTENTCYLVMEYIDGINLEELLKKNGPLPWEIAGVVFHQVSMALAAAHSQGIVHRDIKLANILVKANGIVKLADFGIARDTELKNITRDNEMIGTPHALPPEQIKGDSITARSDIFSLGVALYTAVSGQPPFDGPSVAAIFDRIVNLEPAPFSERDTASVPEFEDIVFTCMAKNPDQRFEDAEALDMALRKCLYQYRAVNDRSEIEKYLADPAGYIQKQRGVRIAEKLEAAEKALAANDIFEALAGFREVLAMDPDNREVEERIDKLSQSIPERQGTSVMDRPANSSARGFHLTWIAFTVVLLALSFGGYRWYHQQHPFIAALEKAPVTAHDSAELSAVPKNMEQKPESIGLPVTVSPVKPVVRPQPLKTVAPSAPPAPVKEPVTAAPAVPADTIVKKECKAALTLYSEVWADIYIDNVKTGRAPTKEPLYVSCGAHTLKLENNLGKQYFTQIKVEADKPLDLTIQKNAFQ